MRWLGAAADVRCLVVVAVLVTGRIGAAPASAVPEVSVDAALDNHPIDPRIYGVAFADEATVADLRVTVNRWGGNATSSYNWEVNATNKGSDWFFESIGDEGTRAGEVPDTFIASTRRSGAEPLMTVPTMGWVARLGPGRARLASYSVAKYGPQQGADYSWFPDAGNGIAAATGRAIVNNDASDAHVRSDPAFERRWVQHLAERWGSASRGGVRLYALDNEPSLWHFTHRDVHPAPATMSEVLDTIVAYGGAIKAADPDAKVLGPEEWGWSGYRYSGYDQEWGRRTHWLLLPDRLAHGGRDVLPWLLDQLRRRGAVDGRRLLDMLTVHMYPAGGESSDDTSPAVQQRRNRSTRALWDPHYVDESWIREPVELIPRLRDWINRYYPGTQIGITEYNWGAARDMNGATTEADLLGIFGRERLNLATYWTVPPKSTPTYNVFKMYRNYDGHGAAFGDVSVSATVPDPDAVSAFAARRTHDGALTVMVINKQPSDAAVACRIANFPSGPAPQVWRLTAKDGIGRVAPVPFDGPTLKMTLPAQSITLLVVPPQS